MRIRFGVPTALVVFVAPVLATPLVAQETAPAGMAAVENARSRDCVGEIAEVVNLNARAAPYVNRIQRIRELAAAVALEDTTQAAPFDMTDGLERDVHEWFVQDHAIALKIVSGDQTLSPQRDSARNRIQDRLQHAADSVGAVAKKTLADADSIQAIAQPCQSAVFVRPAVLEACKATPGSPLCAAAKASPDSMAPDSARFHFVNAPEDLWGIQQFVPWSDPGPLQGGPNGSIVGARTRTRARRGNIMVGLALAPLFRQRSQLDSTDITKFEANLDSLGFTFHHPAFVMAPALELQASVPPPMDGENLYILHFGDVAKPDIIWSAKADSAGGLVQGTIPATAKLLNRLKAGDVLHFTALKVAPGTTQGTAIYTVGILNVNEGQACTQLLGYMQSGDMSKDLNALVPPSSGGGSGS